MADNKPQSIDEVVEESNRELIKIKTVFPFTLFPTELIVDKTKVTIIDNWFLYRHYFPILIKDIKTARVSHNIFFGSLRLEITGYETNPKPINFLRIEDAVKAHQVIVGLTTVVKEQLEKSGDDLTVEQETEKLKNIGSTSAEPVV